MAIEDVKAEIAEEWRTMRNERYLPRFLAPKPSIMRRIVSYKRLRALYRIADGRISLGEMLVLSGAVHRGQ